MQILRTPDECFVDLKDFPFAPHYLEVDDSEGGRLRVHYLDEGPASGDVVLLMHGQPAWSYLYRHMIGPLADAGFRVLAPDLVGFGRSDKPRRQADYSYARHVAWMSEWLLALNLTGVTAFLQDWGSLIGLRLVAAYPARFSAVVLANGGLPTGPVPPELSESLRAAYAQLPVVPGRELEARFRDTSGLPGFLYWRKFCAESPELLDVGGLIDGIGSARSLDEAERRAFNAPFPDERYLAGARRFPTLLPLLCDEPEVAENRAAWEVLKQFDKPFLLAFADDDPVTARMGQPFLDHVPGCRGVAHRTVGPAGHFLQQDQPAQCVRAILDVTGRAAPAP